MKKKLPRVYANKINKSASHNKDVYYSYNEKNRIDAPSLIGKNINQKINTIFKSSNYVYKVVVKIYFEHGSEIKKVVGRNKNYLITIENELIPINEIVDIEFAK